jgi:hypothetical protein
MEILNMRKHGLKALVLAVVAALGLMAFSAVAQAANLELGDNPESGEAGFFLKKSGTQFPTGLTTQAVNGKQIGSSKLLIPGKSAEIVCSEVEVTAASVSNEYENWKTATMAKGGHGHGTLLFKGCKVQEINAAGELTGKELTKCTEELNKATSPAGAHHITANVLLLVKKHENVTYLVAEPLIASKAQAEENEKLTSAFSKLTFGGNCSLPEKVNITGAASVAAPTVDALKPVLKVDTFSAAGKALQTLLGTKLKFGANEAFIQGEAETELVGGTEAWGSM